MCFTAAPSHESSCRLGARPCSPVGPGAEGEIGTLRYKALRRRGAANLLAPPAAVGRAPHGRTYVFLATWFGQQHHPELTDLNLVPAAQLGFVDRLPVDVGAVQTAHVTNTETVATSEEFHMATGNGDIVQKDVAVGMTARGGHVTVQQETAAGVGATTHHEQGGTGRERIGAGRVVPTGNLTGVFFLQNLDTGDGNGGRDVSSTGVPTTVWARTLLFGPASGGPAMGAETGIIRNGVTALRAVNARHGSARPPTARGGA